METDLRNELGDVNTQRKKRTARKVQPHRKTHSTLPRDTLPDLNFPACDGDQPRQGMRFLLQKELRNSDVTPIGRIVLPKKEAEVHLPVLTAKEGFSLTMFDMLTSQVWTFKYRYWPNNKSRMYILENAGSFVKTHSLRVGDFIHVYKDDAKDRYMIRAKKKATTSQVPPAAHTEDGIFDSIVSDIAVASASYSDLYLPLDDGMNMGYGLNYAFSADIPMHFTSENHVQNYSVSSAEMHNLNSSPFPSSLPVAEMFPKLGSIENLFLQDFP